MRLLPAAAAALLLVPAPALAWGKTGHRVIGAIAARLVSGHTRRAVRAILGVEGLAEASAWPDFERSNPDPFWQKEASPFHYVTVPPGRTYAEVGAPPEGDAVTALTRFAATVRDPAADRAAKALALRFIVHIVGDLHQPLHAGNGSDHGANDVKVIFNREPTNLHAVWDSGLIDQEQLSYAEFAAWLLPRITRAERREWRATDPRVWIGESVTLRDRVYPAPAPPRDGVAAAAGSRDGVAAAAGSRDGVAAAAGSRDGVAAGDRPALPELGFKYVYDWTAARDLRLEQGGVRLAAYLDALFSAAPLP